MGPQEDYIETVVTCEGDFHDPQLPRRLECFRQQLKDLLLADTQKPLILKKVEPWNSVRVTFNIPREAALRLKQLAEQGSASLRQLGVLAVQIDGDRLVSLTLATPNNPRTELIIRTHDASAQATTAGPSQASAAVGQSAFDGPPSSSDELGSPGPSSMEVTRKNIEQYLRGSLFNSVLVPSSGNGAGGGPDLSAPGADVFKTPSESGPFRPNNVGSEILASPTGLANFQQRSQFSPGGNLGSGVGAFSPGTPGHSGRNTRLATPGQQSQSTALPQTAAVGFNMLGLPPPPPYPHGHGGVVNNVGSKGKKATASSPLLVNLLQTEPMAGTGAGVNGKTLDKPPKPKRRRTRKKDKPATVTSEEEHVALGSSFPPLNPAGPFSNVLKDTGASAEEKNTLINRQTSPPLPLPSPRLSPGSASAPKLGVDRMVSDEWCVRSPPSSASAALAAMAESQRLSDAESSDTIINPYTGQLEPRDSLTDLSPVKKDPHKTRTSPSVGDNMLMGNVPFRYSPTVAPAVAAALESVIERASAGDPLSSRLESIIPSVPSVLSTAKSEWQPGLSVRSSAREIQERNSAVSTVTAPSTPTRTHDVSGESLIGHLQDLAHNLVSSSPPVASSAAPNYAQHPSSPIQSASHTAALTSDPTVNGPRHTPPGVVPPSPAALVRGQLTVNGPVPSRTSPKTVSAGTGSLGQDLTVQQRHCLSPHVQESNVKTSSHRPIPVHSVQSSGHSEETASVPLVHEQHLPVTSSDSTVHRSVPALQRDQNSSPEVTDSSSVPIPTTSSSSSMIASSDTLNLLNSSTARLSPALASVSHQVSADHTSISTASPIGSKALSEGDDNSNHSGLCPDGIADGNTTSVALLDGSGTKTYNHDSGLGSASERSDDTPSEPGDGEYHSSAVTGDAGTAEGGGSGKPVASIVGKGAVNCKTETPSSMDANTITVGYVHVSEHMANIYSKEMKEQPLLKHIAHLSAQQDTSSIASGDKMLSDDPMHSMSHLVKSSANLTSIASQVAILSGKDTSAALPLPLTVSTISTTAPVQQLQQSMAAKSKGITNCQMTAVHQNGPVRSYSPTRAGPGAVPHGPVKATSSTHHPPHLHNATAVNSHSDGGSHAGGPPSGVSPAPSTIPAVAHTAATSVTTTAHGKFSQDPVPHSLSSVVEQPNKIGHLGDVSSSGLDAYERAALSSSIKQHIARLSTASGSAEVNTASGLDPGNVPPELIAASSRETSEMDILEATQHLYHSHAPASSDDPHSPVFEGEDLVLAGERALTSFLEADVRHATANGGGGSGVSTDARGGSNITSIYSKRSSPVNVNMLNHIYAPGLPAPRRLTESVQRLVKPLPATEHALPQARACKSPGASSSRHSSNGASSPGRASQGGARSPGVSTAVTGSRMFVQDKLAMSQAGFKVNSNTAASVGSHAGYLPTSYPSHTMQESAMVSCCTNSTLLSPHVGVSAQPPAHMVSSPYVVSSSFPVSVSSHPVAAASIYNQPPSSYVSTSSYPASVMPLSAAPTTAGATEVLSSLGGAVPPLTSNQYNLTPSSSSLPSAPVTVSSAQDALPSRFQLPPHTYCTHAAHGTPSTASGFHGSSSLTVSSQLPYSSAVGSVTSSCVSSSPEVSAGYEGTSSAGQSFTPRSNPPGHAVPRPSAGHLVTMCNNLPPMHTVDSNFYPHLTVSSTPLSLAPLPSSPSCAAAAASPSSSTVCVTASTTSTVTVVSTAEAVLCPLTDLTTHIYTPAVQVSSPTITTTTTTTSSTVVLAATVQTDSAVKPHSESGQLASSAPVTARLSPSPQMTPDPSVDLNSGAVFMGPSGVHSSTKITNSVHLPVSSSSGMTEVQQAAADSVISTDVTSSTGGENEQVPVLSEGVLGRTQCGNLPTTETESSETVIPVTQIAEQKSVEQLLLPSEINSSVKEHSGNKSDSIENSSASSDQPTEPALVLKHSQVAVGACEKESAATHKDVEDVVSEGAQVVPSSRGEVRSEGAQSMQASSSEKPPQLQPPPPPLIPAVMPSATPPPPPLTPVPREYPSQAAASHLADTTLADHIVSDKSLALKCMSSVTSAGANLQTESSGQSVLSTPALEPLAAAGKNTSSKSSVEDCKPVDGKQETAAEDGKSSEKNQVPSEDTPNSERLADGSESEPACGPVPAQSAPQSMPELSSEDTRMRRITRKRKSTQSESDSSEPPQKVNSVEGTNGPVGSRDKSAERDSGKPVTNPPVSDQPPKLQREGKRPLEEKDKDKGGSKDSIHHHERNIIEATPEEIAKKLAAASGKRRTYYAYVPEKSLSQSYFDTPVLQGRTRSQSSHTTGKDGTATTTPPAAVATAATTAAPGTQAAASGQPASQIATGPKEEGNDVGSAGSKRSTRLRTKDASDSSSSKRKRGKEHR